MCAVRSKFVHVLRYVLDVCHIIYNIIRERGSVLYLGMTKEFRIYHTDALVVSEPDPSRGEEKGSGSTFELSSRNAITRG